MFEILLIYAPLSSIPPTPMRVYEDETMRFEHTRTTIKAFVSPHQTSTQPTKKWIKLHRKVIYDCQIKTPFLLPLPKDLHQSFPLHCATKQTFAHFPLLTSSSISIKSRTGGLLRFLQHLQLYLTAQICDLIYGLESHELEHATR